MAEIWLEKATEDFYYDLTSLAQIHASLEAHLAHRRLLLEESAVSQVRGTFRLARLILVAGALCLAVGATGYAISLPSTEDDATEASDVDADTATAQPDEAVEEGDDSSAGGQFLATFQIDDVPHELGRQWEQCESAPLTARLIGDNADGTTRVLVTEPKACVGLWDLLSESGLITGVADIDAALNQAILPATEDENRTENTTPENGS
ncbi:MAG: hypothetical protein AAF962_06380 [Actinomycetota bacterium]